MHTLLRMAPACLLGLMLMLAGCVSTQKRYDKAQDLELQGRYAEAAEYYIKVLKKEAEWEGAPERLQEAGNRAVEMFLEDAEAAKFAGNYAAALRALDRLDALRDAAEGVGVTLDVPDDYASYRDELTESAIEAFIARAERAEQAGDWNEALRAYDRAARYTDDPDQRAALVQAQAEVHLRWADNEFARDYFRAGFDRAQQALDLVGPEHPLAERALAMQATALEAGARAVAFLPFWRTEDVAREAPPNVVQDLNDVMFYDHWSAPLPFIAVADPVQLRRELRRLRYDREIITRRQAAEIGRVVLADYVVVGEWTEMRREERNVKEKTRKARMKGRRATTGGSNDTTYVEQDFRLELDAEVVYRIIDPRTRREVDKGIVSADVSGRVKRAVFPGDYRDLDLSGSERSLFEDDERLATEELGDELVDKLAVLLAERIYDRLLRQIP